MTQRHSFEVWQEGMTVAEGECPDRETAEREAFHYAMMYAQDGPQCLVRILPVDGETTKAEQEGR